MDERQVFPLEILHEGFVEALEGWAQWVANPTGHANATKNGLCGHLCFEEGLCAPRRPIIPAEADALRNIVKYLDTVKSWDRRMAANMDADKAIRDYCNDADQATGWRYLQDAFALNGGQARLPVSIPGYRELQAAKLSAIQAKKTASGIQTEFDQALAEARRKPTLSEYNAVILTDVPPGMTVNEYQTAQMKLWTAEIQEDEPDVFRSLAESILGPGFDPPSNQLEKTALETVNKALFGTNAPSGGKFPFTTDQLTQYVEKCDPDSIEKHRPKDGDFSLTANKDLGDMIGMANYLNESVAFASVQEWKIRAGNGGKEFSMTEKMAVLASVMEDFGCKTRGELETTRSTIKETLRKGKTEKWLKSETSEKDLEDEIRDRIRNTETAKGSEKPNVKEFCERLKTATERRAESADPSERQKEDPFKLAITGDKTLDEVEKDVEAKTEGREKEKERSL